MHRNEVSTSSSSFSASFLFSLFISSDSEASGCVGGMLKMGAGCMNGHGCGTSAATVAACWLLLLPGGRSGGGGRIGGTGLFNLAGCAASAA
eukprot:1874212-Amphidinium_carterae.1